MNLQRGPSLTRLKMVKSLYTEPSKDFDDIMDCAKTDMLANMALHSFADEARDLLSK